VELELEPRVMKHNEMKITVAPKLKLHPAAPDRDFLLERSLFTCQ
jgi:hypothetical protein